MESELGPVRNTSPHAARSSPYARPEANTSPRKSNGLLSSLMRKGLGWITGGPVAAGTAERLEAGEDEHGAPLSSTPALARSRTAGSLVERPHYAAPSVPASLSARSGSPRIDSRRRTAHSRLDLSTSQGSLSGSQSFGALPNVNGAEVFGSSDPYHPSSAYLRSHSPFASPGPAVGDLRLRSPSPNSPARASQALYPYAQTSPQRRRGLSPLNPQAGPPSEHSFTGSAQRQRVAWSPTRGYANGTLGSHAGSSVLGGSRREEVFGRRSDEPPTRVPQNEAERILDVLESMRTPHGGPARASHSTKHIKVPVAVPSVNYGDLGYASSNRSVFISPYARRQQQEHEERQEARRRTLSEALRQRDREAEEARRRKTRSIVETELSPPPESRRKRLGMEAERSPAHTERSSRRTGAITRRRAKETAAEPAEDDAMEEDAPQSSTTTNRVDGARASTPRLQSPRVRQKSIETRSPSPPPVPLPKASEPASRGSRASSSTSMRPGRTHSSRAHQTSATTTFTPDDDDDPPTDENALRQAKLPKFSFPANFSFGVAPKPASTLAPERKEEPNPAPAMLASLPPIEGDRGPKLKEAPPQPPTSNLFGFTPSTPASSAPAPLSFAAATPVSLAELPKADASTAPASVSAPANPFASFQPKETSTSASKPVAASPAPTANPFAAFQGFAAAKKTESAAPFSFVKPAEPASSSKAIETKPSEPTSASEADSSMMAEEEKPVSSFFGAPATVTSSQPTESTAAPTSAPAFSFSAPTKSPFTFAPAPKAPIDPFGGKTEEIPASTGTSAPLPFSFASAKTDAPASTSAAAPGLSAPSTGFSFGSFKPAEPASSSTAPASFSFFKPTADASKAPVAASKEASVNGVSTPTFAFTKPAEAAPSPFQFGKPSEPSSAGMEQSKSEGSFGSAPASGTATPFAFGSASPFSAPATTAPSPVVPASTAANPFAAFQASSTPNNGTFGSQPAAQPVFSGFGAATSQPATPAFGFGAQTSAPTTNGANAFGTQPASQPAFGAGNAQAAFGGFGSTPAASPAPFAFGNTSSAPANGFNAFGTQSAEPSPALAAPSGFNFGAVAPPTPDGGANGGFAFNVGSGGNETSSTSPRRIKPLPQGRRGSRR